MTKLLPVVIAVSAVLLSACAQDVELQQDGSSFDKPDPSPCVGTEGSPCSPLPYEPLAFSWGRA